MYMHDYNTDKPEVILMLHPMLAPADTLRQLLGPSFSDYRLLIPDLAAHGEAGKETFVSSAREAAQIRDYMQEHNISQIRLAFAASLGGAVLMELRKLPGLTFGHLVFEGTSFFEKANFVGMTLGKMFVAKHKRAVADPAMAVVKMGQLYGEAMAEPMAKNFIVMNEKSIENIAYACTHVSLPALKPEEQKQLTFAYGEKDGMLKEAKKVRGRRYPQSELNVWKGCDHCQRLSDDPRGYAEYLKKYL